MKEERYLVAPVLALVIILQLPPSFAAPPDLPLSKEAREEELLEQSLQLVQHPVVEEQSRVQ